MTGATAPRLQLELICARVLLPAADGEQYVAMFCTCFGSFTYCWERSRRGDRRCAGLQTRTPPPVSRRGGQRTARRDSRRACLLHRRRGLGQFARGCPPCRGGSALAGGEAQPSFVGNFEAASGPAYGVLLDNLLPGWRRQVRATSDLGDLLASATNRPPTTDVAVAAARYDGATLRAAEEARDRAQQVRVAELRRRFVDGPVLTVPAGGSGTSDTTGSVGIPGVGTVLFRNSPFPLNGAVSMPTAASCALPMGPHCPCRLPGRSKGPPCRGTAGAPL